MSSITSIFCIIGILVFSQCAFAFRIWEDQQQRQIKAEFLSQDAETVTLRLYDNFQRVQFSKNLLSEADLKYLEDIDKQQRANEIREDLLKKLPSTPSEIREAFRNKKDTPGIIFWQNKMQRTDFWLWLSSLLNHDGFEERFGNRIVVAVLEDVSFGALPRDNSMVIRVSRTPNADARGLNPAANYNLLLCFEDSSNRNWGIQINRFITHPRDTEKTFSKLDHWLTVYEDDLSRDFYNFPKTWRSTPDTLPNTLFAIASRVAEVNHPMRLKFSQSGKYDDESRMALHNGLKRYFIVYANGMQQSKFEDLKEATTPLLEAEFGENYIFGFIHQDLEFTRRVDVSKWSSSRGIPVVAKYDYDYRLVLSGPLFSQSESITPDSLFSVIKNGLAAREERRRNAQPGDPFF